MVYLIAITLLLLIEISSSIDALDTSIDTISIYTACNTLPNGLQYILPYGDFSSLTHPLLPVTCLNGNTILDASLSFETYKYYFSSLYMYDIGIGGPDLDDFNSWREWYLPQISVDDKINKYNIQYGISEDCSNTCQYNNDFNSISAYYMTGNFYLCAWITKGDCDMDAHTYECFQCARKGGRSTDILPGVCSHLEYSVDETVHTDHFQCTGDNDNVKPSIGLEHKFCVCYKPNDDTITSITMSIDDYNNNLPIINYYQPTSEQTPTNENENVLDSSNNIIYLSSDDFLYGTYRITQAGTYILSEDIEFNFNAPSEEDRNDEMFSPNSYIDLWWMPKSDGTQEEMYKGSSTWSGPYQLGFFTGITIECSDVIIDLNGFSIGMSYEFYIQQRFFSIIELAQKNFVSGQGPVDFGPYLNSASNVIIKNGILNRASHHAIHGNGVENIQILNIHALNFDVAGIQLNGFNNIQILNCEIGPSSFPPINGRYLHARTLLRRYSHLVDNYGSETLQFANRNGIEYSVNEYVDELIYQMDMIYNYLINDIDYTQSDNERWEKAKDLFLNPSQYLHGDGGVVYGILLNSRGGAVMGFGNAPSESTNAVLNNINIHDLNISPIEKLKFKTDPIGGATRGPVADVFDMIKVSDVWGDLNEVISAKYIGTAYSDVQIIMSVFEESWYVLDHTCFDSGIIDWTLNGVSFDVNTIHSGCNTDIQLHINKGAIGLRIDNINGFDINNIQINNLLNTGNLGYETICGAYSQGNAHQDPAITPGYTGTEGYGITITQSINGNINGGIIDQIETFYGNCYGIALFKDSQVVFNNIVVSNIIAGSQLELTDLRPYQNYLPNKIPKACSVFNNNYNTQYTIGNDGIIGTNINGYLVCNANDNDLIGECDITTNCQGQYVQSYFDYLAQVYSSPQQKYEYINNMNGKQLQNKSYAKIGLIILILLIVVSFIIYYRHSFNNYKQILIKSLNTKSYDGDEYTPLLD